MASASEMPVMAHADDGCCRDDEAGNDGIGRAPHLDFTVCFFSCLEDGDERRSECTLAKQAAERSGTVNAIAKAWSPTRAEKLA